MGLDDGVGRARHAGGQRQPGADRRCSRACFLERTDDLAKGHRPCCSASAASASSSRIACPPAAARIARPGRFSHSARCSRSSQAPFSTRSSRRRAGCLSATRGAERRRRTGCRSRSRSRSKASPRSSWSWKLLASLGYLYGAWFHRRLSAVAAFDPGHGRDRRKLLSLPDAAARCTLWLAPDRRACPLADVLGIVPVALGIYSWLRAPSSLPRASTGQGSAPRREPGRPEGRCQPRQRTGMTHHKVNHRKTPERDPAAPKDKEARTFQPARNAEEARSGPCYRRIGRRSFRHRHPRSGRRATRLRHRLDHAADLSADGGHSGNFRVGSAASPAHGIAGNVCRHYPAWVLDIIVATAVFVANTINIAADLARDGRCAASS